MVDESSSQRMLSGCGQTVYAVRIYHKEKQKYMYMLTPEFSSWIGLNVQKFVVRLLLFFFSGGVKEHFILCNTVYQPAEMSS